MRLLDTFIEVQDRSGGSLDDLKEMIHDERKRASKSGLAPVAALAILYDLIAQRWSIIERCEGGLSISPPARSTDRAADKARIQQGLHVARDEQLAEPSVRAFINSMNRTGGSTKSAPVTALFRDGVDLSAKLQHALSAPDGDKAALLEKIIKPYIQFVSTDERCAFTGIRLTDIWRYFRHTWATPYRSVPGRTMQILIRDAAAPNHPVMGIASLASAVVAQDSRDKMIGWLVDDVVESIMADTTNSNVNWIKRTLRVLIDRVYIADFLSEGRVTQALIKKPKESTIAGLRGLADSINLSEIDDVIGAWTGSLPEYEREARTPLFTKKRAERLADLLAIRRTLQIGGFFDKNGIREGSVASVRDALRRFVRQVKSETVGINMMEINVCGAVPPYNPLLVGKLVAMLMLSPEVRREYRLRYDGVDSIIASKIAGRPVAKKPLLVMLSTSALYGGGLDQYTGAAVPGHIFGGSGKVKYQFCGETKSYSTFQFSQLTIRLLEDVAREDLGRIQISSKFGEGVSPKMRKLRQGLDRLGLDSDRLLRTESSRSVYIAPLAVNSLDVLLGKSNSPRYVLQGRGTRKDSDLIVKYWVKKWLLPRLNKGIALEAVARHDVRYPLLHGAFVRLPSGDFGQGILSYDFDEDDVEIEA